MIDQLCQFNHELLESITSRQWIGPFSGVDAASVSPIRSAKLSRDGVTPVPATGPNQSKKQDLPTA